MDESWQPGEEVWLAGDPPVTGTVTDVERADGEVIYRVFLETGEHRYVAAKDVRARPGAGELRMIGRDELLCRLLLYKLRRPLSDVLYTYRASRTAFEVYQFKPIFKFLKTDRRSLLIADEVGLGKTIEACLIYLELKARADLARVLVLCPSALREKWRSELKLRFDEDFAILDRTALSTWLRDYQRTDGHQRLRGIASLELIRRTELQEQFFEAALALDLLIIDEAHHVRNAATETHRAARLLADRSENVLLLTATPLQTRSEDLYNILQLVDPGTFSDSTTFPEQLRPNAYVNRAIRALGHIPPDRVAALGELRELDAFAETRDHPILRRVCTRLADPSALAATETAALRYDLLELNSLAYVFTRTRKRDVAATAQRRARTVRVPLSPAEREFYEALLDFVRSRVQAETGALAPFVIVAQERQAASCLVATRRYLEHVLRARVRQLQLEDGGTQLEDDRSGNVAPAELAQIRELLDLSATIGEVDTKFDKLVDLLRLPLAESVGNKVLVFSFFRRTIEYLRERLARLGYVVYVVHGGIDVDQRPSIITRFEAEERPSVLLSTEVGAEGLDFQFCDTLVNYDLPWNPMKVEQRIGRIDRYGQQRPTIHIVNFVLADTIEDRILERLYDRIEIFRNSVGDLEPILGDEIQRLTATLFRRRLTPEEEERLAEETALRIANLRIEQERFEQHRAELMAHDSLFLSEVSDAVSSGRFVSAAEIAATVQVWLRAAFPDSEFVQADQSTWLLRADARLQAHCQEVVASVRENNSTGIRFLQRLTTGRAGVPCTFDDEAAFRNRNLEFLNLRHPFVGAAIDFFKSKFGGVNLRLVLDGPLRERWQAERAFGLRQLWAWFAQYLYLPRLRDISVLEGAVRDGSSSLLWRTETFAYAAAREEGGEYRGVVAGRLAETPVTSTSLIVDGAVLPDPLPGAEPPQPLGGGVGGGVGAAAGGSLASAPAPAPRIRRFHGEVALSDPRRPIPELTKVVDEVIDRLAQQTDVRLRVTLEIEAEHAAADGFSDETVRTISENAKTLRFRDFGWEKE